jgi:hypothetical protein
MNFLYFVYFSLMILAAIGAVSEYRETGRLGHPAKCLFGLILGIVVSWLL